MNYQKDSQINMDFYNEQEVETYIEEQQRTNEENSDVADAVIPPADIVAFNEQRSCADIYRMYEKGQLDINPDFQRGEVWSPRAQTLFVDSLMKQLPIPSMCICLDVKTQKRIVIDGLQRISTIVKFLNPNSEWKLSDIEDVDSRIANKSVSDIKKDNSQLYETLENLSIPITVLRCDSSKKDHMEYLFQIFYRLNSGGNKLYNQEIRNCIYSGPFNDLLKRLALSNLWMQFAGVDKKKVESSRFANEERILRFFAFYDQYESYKGRLAGFLNDYMGEHRMSSEQALSNYTRLFDRVISFTNNYILQCLNLVKSKNLSDALLVGIAKNIDRLECLTSEEVAPLFEQLIREPEFCEDSIREGLGRRERVINRINKAIEVFGRG